MPGTFVLLLAPSTFIAQVKSLRLPGEKADASFLSSLRNYCFQEKFIRAVKRFGQVDA
jgi:hypothetical protein